MDLGGERESEGWKEISVVLILYKLFTDGIWTE
jgi:hypothetical protein